MDATGVHQDIVIMHSGVMDTIFQGFSWTEIYFGHFVQAAPILFGHFEKILDIFSDTHFYHHKWKLLSALFIMKLRVVLLPCRTVSEA